MCTRVDRRGCRVCECGERTGRGGLVSTELPWVGNGNQTDVGSARSCYCGTGCSAAGCSRWCGFSARGCGRHRRGGCCGVCCGTAEPAAERRGRDIRSDCYEPVSPQSFFAANSRGVGVACRAAVCTIDLRI